jgi:hypothetical protein
VFLAGSSASRLMSPLNFFFSFLGFADQQSLLELSRLAGLNIRGDIFLILWELMQSDVASMLVLQLLKTLAGGAPEFSPLKKAVITN